MRLTLLRSVAALATSLGLAVGTLCVAAAPAEAARFSVRMTASVTRVTVGQTVTLSGKVSPRPSIRYVYLQQRDVGSTAWRKVAKLKATRAGNFRITVTPSDDTDRSYRIYKPKQGHRKAGYSPAVRVVVDPKPSAPLTISPKAGPLSGGTTVTITGSGLAGTTAVTFTPQVLPSDTADGSGVLPEVRGTVVATSASSVTVTTPASLGGANLVTVYTPSAKLTTTYTYVMTSREPSAFEQAVLAELNARRATPQTCRTDSTTRSMPAVGPIRWDGGLADLTLSHSRDLAARQNLYQGLSHVTYGTSGFSVRIQRAGARAPFGEILALTPAAYTAAGVVDGWMRSTAGHCESVMNKNWTKAGVGVSAGTWLTSGGVSLYSNFSNVDFQ